MYATMAFSEGGLDLSSIASIAHECKVLDVYITEAMYNDPVQWQKMLKAFEERFEDNALSAMNARVNMTIHCGINDDMKVIGIRVEKYYLVGL